MLRRVGVRREQTDRGAAAVEFALVLPLLIRRLPDLREGEDRPDLSHLRRRDPKTCQKVAGAARPAADVQVGDVVTVTAQFRSHDMNIPFVPSHQPGSGQQTADSSVEYVRATPQECT